MAAAESSMRTRQLSTLKAEATHARERYTLYRAKCYKQPKVTSPSRLQELKRIWILAQRRLERVKDNAA